MQDEGLHEIQLNGKQLVFLFMSATIVAVVIFLCGVMVGRGVNAPASTSIAATPVQPPVDPTAVVQSLPAPSTAGSTGTAGSSTANEDLTYAKRLESRAPVPETLRPAAEAVPEPAAGPAAGSVVDKPTVVPPAPIDASLKEPAGKGWAVQVAALRTRPEAETMARRLSTKGYPTFVTTAGDNFRVRIGKYENRRDADATASRLAREEHFKPWITR
jgi:cell division septation protein DedD